MLQQKNFKIEIYLMTIQSLEVLLNSASQFARLYGVATDFSKRLTTCSPIAKRGQIP